MVKSPTTYESSVEGWSITQFEDITDLIHKEREIVELVPNYGIKIPQKIIDELGWGEKTPLKIVDCDVELQEITIGKELHGEEAIHAMQKIAALFS